jgi:hypothetical protein
MSRRAPRESALIRKIRSLPRERVAEVDDSSSQREDRQLMQAAAKLADRAFRKVWDNPADAVYDRR